MGAGRYDPPHPPDLPRLCPHCSHKTHTHTLHTQPPWPLTHSLTQVKQVSVIGTRYWRQTLRDAQCSVDESRGGGRGLGEKGPHPIHTSTPLPSDLKPKACHLQSAAAQTANNSADGFSFFPGGAARLRNCPVPQSVHHSGVAETPSHTPTIAATLSEAAVRCQAATGLDGCLLYTSPSPRDS